MYIDKFLATHPIFSTQELSDYALKILGHSPSHSTVYNLIQHHEKRGHIIQIRRGLYYTLPREATDGVFPVDPFLVASKLASDAVLAFHSAFWIHQVAYSTSHIIYYLTRQRTRPRFQFQGNLYVPVHPSSTLRKSKNDFGVTNIDREGVKIRVTALERTLVDVLHKPLYGGNLEEVWQSLNSISYLNIDQVIEYTKLLKNSSIAAKVGFFLESRQEQLRVSPEQLDKLRKARPKSAQYFQRKSDEPQKLITNWNLIVPKYLLEHMEGYSLFTKNGFVNSKNEYQNQKMLRAK